MKKFKALLFSLINFLIFPLFICSAASTSNNASSSSYSTTTASSIHFVYDPEKAKAFDKQRQAQTTDILFAFSLVAFIVFTFFLILKMIKIHHEKKISQSSLSNNTCFNSTENSKSSEQKTTESDNAVKNENSDNSRNVDNRNYKMAWYGFYIYFRMPVSLIINFLYLSLILTSAQTNTDLLSYASFVIQLGFIIYLFVTFWGMKSFYKYGYYLNIGMAIILILECLLLKP